MPLVTMEMSLKEALKKADITPNIVPEDFTPSTIINVQFPNGEDVALGNFLKPSESSETPKVTFVAPDENAKYTLLVVDPDAPTKANPKWGPYRHWIITNIPGSADFSQANEQEPYLGPGPPPKTGDHRYIFLLYKQPEAQAVDFGTLSIEKRNNWEYQTLIEKNQLELVAVNFFISRHDDNE
ncbi:phosphatidylethanolamine-binding protein [Cokeromyces recurvatus]|uniref:phosphatidylethanolamine-binding protein n=1 Tax=Cokeromyces recurvatus TaxID=90255 RepID=UPI00221E6522|nr:phosphatidylethanolamine-binding protein [Cokeromyces recurvatus]KAI7905346.1 phosphatidylethanolamine-binding protein [Cokeromyces recurvatus]